MKIRLIVSSLLVIVIIVIISVALVSLNSQSSNEPEPKPVYDIDFTYSDIDIITEILATKGIHVSSSTEISDRTVDQYCTFYDDENKQSFVEYCTTTAVIDSDGKPLGNINLGGTSDDSTLALAILEVSPFVNSNQNDVYFVFKSMIETFVCDCWNDLKPGDFESVDQWLDAAAEQYVDSGKKSLKSTIDGLDEKKITLEISSNEKSILWILIVVK